MTALQPCNICNMAKGCALKAKTAASVKGLGLTMVRFKCPILVEQFRPGRRVRATITAGYTGQGPYGDELEDAIVSATVIGPAMKPGRFVIWIDDDDQEDLNLKSPRGVCAISPTKMTFLDEPDRPERVARLAYLDQTPGDGIWIDP